MKFYTDYTFPSLGDIEGSALLREVTLLDYDGNKYVRVLVCGETHVVKSGYIYTDIGPDASKTVVTKQQLNQVTQGNVF